MSTGGVKLDSEETTFRHDNNHTKVNTITTGGEMVTGHSVNMQSHGSSHLSSNIKLTNPVDDVLEGTKAGADPIDTPPHPHPDMARGSLITVLDVVHGMFTGHADEKSHNEGKDTLASAAVERLIQQRKYDPDHTEDTKLKVHVINTKNSPVLKDFRTNLWEEDDCSSHSDDWHRFEQEDQMFQWLFLHYKLPNIDYKISWAPVPLHHVLENTVLPLAAKLRKLLSTGNTEHHRVLNIQPVGLMITGHDILLVIVLDIADIDSRQLSHKNRFNPEDKIQQFFGHKVRIDILLQQLAFGEHIRISQLVDHGNHQHKPPAGIGNFVEVSLTILLAVKLLTDHKAKQQAVTVYVILHTGSEYSTMPGLIIRTTPRTVGSIAVYFTEGRILPHWSSSFNETAHHCQTHHQPHVLAPCVRHHQQVRQLFFHNQRVKLMNNVIANGRESRCHPLEMANNGHFNNRPRGHLLIDLSLVIGQIENTPGVKEEGSDLTGY